MQPLVIEYVLEGHRRGYDFTSATGGYSDDDLRLIWRSAMPRGQGWGRYVGARSLKAFPLEGARRIAVSETLVTDMQDENGRSGIRRAVIQVLSRADYPAYLAQRLKLLPGHIRAQVERMPTFTQRLAITNSLMTHRSEQLVLLRTYQGPEDWQMMEGLMVKLALAPPRALRRTNGMLPFTTLALNPHDETTLVGLPTEKQSALGKKMASVSI